MSHKNTRDKAHYIAWKTFLERKYEIVEIRRIAVLGEIGLFQMYNPHSEGQKYDTTIKRQQNVISKW